MTAKKTDGTEALALERAVVWVRTRLQAAQDARGPVALRKPPRVRLQAPRRGWFAGWWSARLAAGSGVRIEEFLHHRLSRYFSVLPVSPDRLPVEIDIQEGGLIAVTPREGERPTPPWLDTYLRANGGGSVQSDVMLAQAEVARVAAELEAHAPRLAAAEQEAEEAAHHPSIAEVDGGSLEALGRPLVPPPWTAVIYAFAFCLLVAEAWHLAIPVLEGAGVRTQDLVAEAQRNPAGVGLGFVFALGAAVSLFTFVDIALRRTRTLYGTMSAAGRARATALGAAAGMGFAAAVSWSIAGLRPGPSPVDLQYARFTLFLLALALPVTTSCLLSLSRRLAAQRAEALAAAVAWDQVHYRSLAGFTRKAAAAAAERKERERLEAQRDAAIRRLRALRARAQLAERYAAEAGDAEAVELDRLALAVASALELDRYEFLRQTGSHGVAQPHPRPQGPRRDRERTLGLAG